MQNKLYVIEEEELEEFYHKACNDGMAGNYRVNENVTDFLKSKQPIELVATVESSDCARHLLVKEFTKTEIGFYKSKTTNKYIFQEGKYQIFIQKDTK